MADLTQTEELAWRITTNLAALSGSPLEACANMIDEEIRGWLVEQREGRETLERVVAMAARVECKNRWADDDCDAADCLSCAAARLLPVLKCACGKWELRRYVPSMWENPVQHTPEKCEAPLPPERCPTCQRVHS